MMIMIFKSDEAGAVEWVLQVSEMDDSALLKLLLEHHFIMYIYCLYNLLYRFNA